MTDTNLIEALKLLDVNEKSHWTADGLPRVDVVAELTGIKDLKRADITAAAPTFTRENPASEEPAEEEVETKEETSEEQEPSAEEEVAKDNVEAAESTLGEEELTTFGLTESDILDELELAVAAAEAKVAEADAAVAEAQKVRAEAAAARDALLDERAANVHPHQNQLDIMQFLETQKQLRLERASRVQTIVTSQKAPIDQAMVRRKGFGFARPVVPAKAGV